MQVIRHPSISGAMTVVYLPSMEEVTGFKLVGVMEQEGVTKVRFLRSYHIGGSLCWTIDCLLVYTYTGTGIVRGRLSPNAPQDERVSNFRKNFQSVK